MHVMKKGLHLAVLSVGTGVAGRPLALLLQELAVLLGRCCRRLLSVYLGMRDSEHSRQRQQALKLLCNRRQAVAQSVAFAFAAQLTRDAASS